MEQQNGTNDLEKMRLAIFIGIHIILCLVVFWLAKELTDLWPSLGGGSELEDLINAITGPFKILSYIVGCCASVATALGVAVSLLIPFRSVAVTRTSRVTEFELNMTLEFMYVSAGLTAVAGVIFIGLGCLFAMGILFLPLLGMEGTVYWTNLRDLYLSGRQEAIPPEDTGQTVKAVPEERPDETREATAQSMQKADIARFVVFIVCHVLLCVAVFCYTMELRELSSELYADGTVEITGWWDIVLLLRDLWYILAMLGWTAVLLIPLKLIALRKVTRAADFEIQGTLAVMAAGSVLTLAVGAFALGWEQLRYMVEMFVPVLILEIAVYWNALRGIKRSGHSKKGSSESSNSNRPKIKRKMQTTEKVRFLVYIVIHGVLCLAVFGGAKYVLRSGQLGDLLTLFDVVFSYLICNIVLMDGAVVLLTAFRLISIRQSSQVTDFEVKGTTVVMIVGIVLTVAAGVYHMKLDGYLMTFILFFPIVFLELLLYWSGLAEQKNKS